MKQYMYILFTLLIVVIIIIYVRNKNNNNDNNNDNIEIHDPVTQYYINTIKKNIILILHHMFIYKNDKFKHYQSYIENAYDKIKYIKININKHNDDTTSYTINKQKLIMCIRSKNDEHKLYDLNLIMYVVLHELAHIISPFYNGHDELFNNIFKIVVDIAIELNLYKKIDFVNYPTEYCGLIIDNSIV
jgi:hypothetical protein